MTFGRLCGVGVGLGMALTALSLSLPGATAVEPLNNGGFEEWSGTTLLGWSVVQGITGPEEIHVHSGLAARVDGDHAQLRQIVVGATPGATYSGALWVAGDGAIVTLRLRTLNDGFELIGVDTDTRITTSSFSELSVELFAALTSPAAYLEVVIEVDGAGPTYIDSASLIEFLPPTATPTPDPPTATPTLTAVPMTPTAIPATPTAVSASSTPTRTPTRTATPTRTPTPKPSAIPQTVIVTLPTPSGTGQATSTPPPGSGASGGLLLNGDFEAGDLADQSKPRHWAKFGGELTRDAASYRGSRAAKLTSSTDSTKWLTQLVEVQPAQWYSARAYSRIASGDGEVFVRLSWYAFKNGDGSAIRNDDSPVSSASTWALLDTGAVRSPPNAYSVRVRLMVRPSGPMSALFDDAEFTTTSQPAPTPSATATAASATSTAGATTTPKATSTPRSTPSGAGNRQTPVVSTLVNVAGPHTLRISEFLSDPSEPGRDGPFEWVELINVGTEPVSTAGWKLGDGAELDPLPVAAVPPGGYLVVAASQSSLLDGIPIVRVEDGEIGNALNNDGDTLVLVAPDGTEVDLVSYGDDTTVYEPPPPAPDTGETLGIRTAGADPEASNWAITLRPTPGDPNLFPAPPPEVTAVAGARVPSGEPGDSRISTTEIREDQSTPSPVPWIVLGAAITAGAVAAYGQRERAAPLWKKVRRGR